MSNRGGLLGGGAMLVGAVLAWLRLIPALAGFALYALGGLLCLAFAIAALRGEKVEIGFGSQIRSYTLHPAQRVKDHRTGVEVGNAQGVLDGDLDRFIRATLLQGSAGAEAAP